MHGKRTYASVLGCGPELAERPDVAISVIPHIQFANCNTVVIENITADKVEALKLMAESVVYSPIKWTPLQAELFAQIHDALKYWKS